jgi:hypothetical protein
MSQSNLVMISCSLVNAKAAHDRFMSAHPKSKFCYRCWHERSIVLVFNVSES